MTNNPPECVPEQAAAMRARLNWFKAEILPHEAALRARLRRVMPRRADIDNIVAEAMARAFATKNFGQVTSGRAWLFRVARNLVIDEARRAQIVGFEQLVEIDLIEEIGAAEARLEARDALRRLEAIVETLPIQARRAFILRRVHDKSVRDIAEEMGLSVFTVDKHIARATAIVMRAMAEFGDLGSAPPEARGNHAQDA